MYINDFQTFKTILLTICYYFQFKRKDFQFNYRIHDDTYTFIPT